MKTTDKMGGRPETDVRDRGGRTRLKIEKCGGEKRKLCVNTGSLKKEEEEAADFSLTGTESVVKDTCR